MQHSALVLRYWVSERLEVRRQISRCAIIRALNDVREKGRNQLSGKVAPKKLNIWEDILLGIPFEKAATLLPGLALAAVLVGAAIFISDQVNRFLGYQSLVSYITMAIILGLVVRNVIHVPEAFRPGVGFCLRKVLRLGIIMMGIRLSIFDAAQIGAWGIPIVLVAITTGLVVTTCFTRLIKLPERLGVLIAVGTGICGVSAIAATAPAIGAKDEEVAYAVANITVFGIVAMFFYPYIAHYIFGGNAVMAGLFVGTSIHDTSQVTGAGLIYDQVFSSGAKPSVAEVAVITKLVRNIFMALVIPLMAVIYARRLASQGKSGGKVASMWSLFPYFILGFVMLAAVRSLGDAGLGRGALALGLWDSEAWQAITSSIAGWATYVLAAAVAGIGLGTGFETIKGLGVKPFFVGLLSALAVGAASILAVMVLGQYVAV
ncbi:MAG: putative sulfate exporter family transporter [Dehalococcoidia bacterium]|nr:putative sulfate exporter family transporter [Dehalococcoidia bacterium]